MSAYTGVAAFGGPGWFGSVLAGSVLAVVV
jgi:hypothetical protein